MGKAILTLDAISGYGPTLMPLYFVSSIVPILRRRLELGYLINDYDRETIETGRKWKLGIQSVIHKDQRFYVKFRLQDVMALIETLFKEYGLRVAIIGQMPIGFSQDPHTEAMKQTNRWLKTIDVDFTFDSIIRVDASVDATLTETT